MAVKVIASRALPTRKLRSHPDNIRTDIGDVDDLAASMQAQGVLQPLIVYPQTIRGEQLYVVVDGHRRLRAARQAAIGTLPCLVTSPGPSRASVLETMLAAAMHQRLDPLDQGRAFSALTLAGVPVERIAQRTGYSVATVRDRMDLLVLPPDAQRMVADKTITLGAAKDLTQQLKKSPSSASVAARAPKQTWLNRSHPSAAGAKASCTPAHRDSRVLVGGVACGQCWEYALTGEDQA